MNRYYFHQRIDGELLLDPDGYEYPDLAAARASALVSARSLWAAAIHNGDNLCGQAIEIANDAGVAVEIVPLEDALPGFLEPRQTTTQSRPSITLRPRSAKVFG